MSEVRFVVLDELIAHGLTDHMDDFMLEVANRTIWDVHGRRGIPDPSDIEITVGAYRQPGLTLTSWHEIIGAESPSRFQVTQSGLELVPPSQDLRVNKNALFHLNDQQRACFQALVCTYMVGSVVRWMQQPPPPWAN